MIEFLFWFSATFVAAFLVFTAMDVTQSLYGDDGSLLVAISLVILMVVDYFVEFVPTFDSSMGIFGYIVAFIIAVGLNMVTGPKIKEKLQVDGEPRFV